MLFEIAGIFRPAMFGEIGWRANGDDAQRMQPAGDQGLVGGVADPHGDIETLGNEIGLLVGGPEFDVHIGIEFQKTADDRRDIGRRKQDRRADFQRAGNFAAQTGGLGPGFDDLRNRRLDALVEQPPGFGRFRSPRGAFHEFDAERAFQRHQRPVERLQRPPKMPRGRRLAALLDNSQEGFEIVQPFQFDIPLLIYCPSQGGSKMLQLQGTAGAAPLPALRSRVGKASEATSLTMRRQRGLTYVMSCVTARRANQQKPVESPSRENIPLSFSPKSPA